MPWGRMSLVLGRPIAGQLASCAVLMEGSGQRAALAVCARLFGGSATTAAAATGGSEPLTSAPAAGAAAESQASEEERAASLPAEQLAKALLAGNVRAQLTTITAGAPGADESKLSSSVTSYLSPRGEAPVVLVSQDSDREHLANLQESSKASLATGHISPPWFIQRLRATGWLPRRVALLGRLEPMPAGEVKFAVEQARKACASAPGLAALLPEDAVLPGLLGYRLQDISQAVYVDAAGRQHPVDPQELDSCFLDPLALSQHDLLTELNSSPAWQAQLQLFAAAYLGVHASQVLLTEADRLGFTLLGAPAVAGSEGVVGDAGAASRGAGQQQQQQQQRWRQFRIGSARELRSAKHFFELLEQMRDEVKAAAGAA